MSKKIITLVVLASMLGIYIYFVIPLEEERAILKEKIFLDYKTLARYEENIGGTQKAENELGKALRELEKIEQSIIHESDVSLASAKLQAKIQDLAQAANLKVTSIKPLQAMDFKAYKGLPIYVDGIGDINQLSDFLKLVDSGSDLISIERINVSAAIEDDLRIKMQILGLMKQ